MATWILVWFIIGIASTILLIASLVALGRHGLFLWRSVQRLNEEAQPLADDISRASDRQSRRIGQLRTKAERLRSSGPRG